VSALSEHDAARLLEGVARIAEPLTLEALREESILVVHWLIPSVSVSWNEISSTGAIEAVSVPEIDRWSGLDEAFARALTGHPVIAHTRQTNDGRPRAISDFWSVDQFHANTLYQELYRRLSTEDQLSFTVPTPDVLIGVAINRDRVGFSGGDRTIANLIRPHILQAYRNAVANERIGKLMSIVDYLSSDRDAGLVVLNAAGTPGEPTPAAAVLLSRWSPAKLRPACRNRSVTGCTASTRRPPVADLAPRLRGGRAPPVRAPDSGRATQRPGRSPRLRAPRRSHRSHRSGSHPARAFTPPGRGGPPGGGWEEQC
jgi:hypothetical protein